MDSTQTIEAFDARVENALNWLRDNAGLVFDTTRAGLERFYNGTNWLLSAPSSYLVMAVFVGLGLWLMGLRFGLLAGLVGAGGLGAEVTRGLTRMEMGLGLRAGLSIVALALLLDRLTRAALQGAMAGREERSGRSVTPQMSEQERPKPASSTTPSSSRQTPPASGCPWP